MENLEQIKSDVVAVMRTIALCSEETLFVMTDF